MPIGPGKYDDLCNQVYEQAGIANNGGAIVIVAGGNRGSGFSVKADLKTTVLLPDLLEFMASQIRADLEKGKL